MDDNTVYIIIGVAVVAILYLVVLYNSIVSVKNQAQRGWADVISYERNKLKIIPKLEEVLKSYEDYEGNILNSITGLREHISKLDNYDISADKLNETESLTRKLQSGISLHAENYPDLKSSKVYLRFMKDWRETNENVTAALSVFNRTVEIFNNKIQTFPNVIINALLLRNSPIKPFDDKEALMSFEYRPNI